VVKPHLESAIVLLNSSRPGRPWSNPSRSAAVIDRSSAAVFGRTAAEPTPLPPSARSSEKGPISRPMVRSLQPAMDDIQRRGVPARKTTLAAPAPTRECQACKSINDATARTCQVAPPSALQHPAPEGHDRACPAMPVALAEIADSLHRTNCDGRWRTDIAERSDTCRTCSSAGKLHRPFGRPFRPPPPEALPWISEAVQSWGAQLSSRAGRVLAFSPAGPQ